MSYIERNKYFFERLLTMLEHQYGKDSEIVLHDLTKPYESTIIDIRNGHITNRNIGDPGSNLGLEVLKGSVEDGDRYNYITYLPQSRIIRSSSMYIRDGLGNVVGALCINTDITESIHLEKFIKRYNNFDLEEQTSPASSVKEVFVNNVQDLLDHLIAEAQEHVGCGTANMTKENKIEFLSLLDSKGAFLISKSGEKLCEYLGISKFTLYRYLDIARSNGVKKKTDTELLEEAE